jgi:hypothetical protein
LNGRVVRLASNCEIELADIGLELPLEVLGGLEELFEQVLVIVDGVSVIILRDEFR